MHHCSGDDNANPVAEDQIDPVSRFDKFLNERRFEYLKVLSYLRQTAA